MALLILSVESYVTYINVIGFKSIDMWNGTLYYDNEKVMYVLNWQGSGTYGEHTTWTDSGAFDTVPSDLRPAKSVYSSTSDTRLTVRVNDPTGKIQYVNSASISNPYFVCSLTWLRV